PRKGDRVDAGRGLVGRRGAWLALLVGAVAMIAAGSLVLPRSPDAPAAPSPRLGDGWQRGVAVTDWTSYGLGSGEAREAFDDAIAVGADRVVLSPTLLVADPHSDTIAPDGRVTVADSALRDAIGAARARGLAVTVKP